MTFGDEVELIAELCPDGVEYVKLGDVIKLEKGKQLNKEFLTEQGKYPAYNGGVTHQALLINIIMMKIKLL